MGKTLLIIFLFLVAIFYKLSANTNDVSPELQRKLMKELEDRYQFLLTNECPIQATIVWNGEPGCQISYRGHTNIIVYEPMPEQLFDFNLFSEDGKEIPRKSSYAFSQTLKPDKKLLAGNYSIQDDVIRGHDRKIDFKNGNYSHFWNFDVIKFFRVKEPGEYRLEVKMRLFTKDTNGIFQPFILPAAETKIKISADNFH